MLATESVEVPPTSSCSHYFNTTADMCPPPDIFWGDCFQAKQNYLSNDATMYKRCKKADEIVQRRNRKLKILALLLFFCLLTSKNGLTVSILYSSLKLSSLSRERKHCRRVKMGKQLLAKSSLLLTTSPCMNCHGYSAAERRSGPTTQPYGTEEERFCFA